MKEVEDVVTELRQVPAGMIGTQYEQIYWTCHAAADLLLKTMQHLEDLRAMDRRSYEKRERNMTILKRRMRGERTKDLAAEYKVSPAMISKIVQREKDKILKEKQK